MPLAPASQQRRRDILMAGKRVFFECGYQLASVDRIAEAAGTTKRTVYDHFGAKEALFAEVVAFACRQFVAMLPTAELDRLLAETLDACSHRLDVWVTAVANAILQRQRSGQTAPGTPALHLGGYGWVENVRPAARRAVVTGAEATAVARLDDSRKQDLPAAARSALQPVMQPQTDNGGFIHAPSMTQAAAAAVLRSGYMTHQGTPDAPALAIDGAKERLGGTVAPGRSGVASAPVIATALLGSMMPPDAVTPNPAVAHAVIVPMAPGAIEAEVPAPGWMRSANIARTLCSRAVQSEINDLAAANPLKHPFRSAF